MTSPLAQALAFQNQVQPAQTPISPTNVLGAYQLASQVAEQNYQAKLQQMQALWGGLAALGGAGIRAFGPGLLNKWMGGAATPAAATGAAAPATTSGIDAATGAPWAASSTSWAAPAAADTGTVAADMGTGAGAGTVAGDLSGATGASVGDLGELASLAPDAAATGSVAADIAAAAPEVAAATDASLALPDFLAAFLPFLA